MEHILVVDDNSDVRDLAGSCLIEHGMKPLFAEDGKKALAIVNEFGPDAVLTDLHMPEMGGLELVREMRREHPGIPVVLMTSNGSEQDAVDALRAGALSYVPKKTMRGNLCDAMGMVVAAVEAKRYRERVRSFLDESESRFILGYEMDGIPALVSHLQTNLERLNFCDEVGVFQISTALTEALTNAIDHGNLELDSRLREESHGDYDKERQERSRTGGFADRKVYITEKISRDRVTYTVRDEGSGFDVSSVPDPRDGLNLLKPSGRGLMLIRTFMDDVKFNTVGNEITMSKTRNSGDK